MMNLSKSWVEYFYWYWMQFVLQNLTIFWYNKENITHGTKAMSHKYDSSFVKLSRFCHSYSGYSWVGDRAVTFLVLCLCMVLFTVSAWLSWALCEPCALVDCLAPPTFVPPGFPSYRLCLPSWLVSLCSLSCAYSLLRLWVLSCV